MRKPNKGKPDSKKPQNCKNRSRNVKREQPRKDSDSKRINLDNERVTKEEYDAMKRAGMKDGRSNDISWYTRNGELMKSATSTNFITTTGMRPPFGSKLAVPGIMAIKWSPVFGSEENDPLNQAANSTYSFLVHANSRNYQYDAPDLMVMLLAGMNVFAAIAAGLRAYGTLRNFEGQDFYTPAALVSAMGFNYPDLRDNQSQMWFDLNQLIAETKQIWVPNTMPVLERWYWLSSNIYRDGDSVKSQYYLFVPQQFYIYNAGSQDVPGSQLQAITPPASGKWSDYVTMVRSMIDALIRAQDRGIILGDVLNAYGPDKIFAMNPITSDFTVVPTYDPEVLTQIENATVLGYAPGNVIQNTNTNALQQQWPLFTSATFTNLEALPSIQVLNFHQQAAPTSEQIMIATRLKAASSYSLTFSGSESPTYQIGPWTYGTEVVIDVVAFGYDWSTGSPVLQSFSLKSLIKGSSGATLAKSDMYLWSTFDWAPWIYMPSLSSPALPTEAFQKFENLISVALGDYDNYVYLTDIELQKMNISAVYSEFGVPTL